MRSLLRVLAGFALLIILGLATHHIAKAPRLETKQKRFLQHHFADLYKISLNDVFIRLVYPIKQDRDIGLTFFSVNVAVTDSGRMHHSCIIDASLQFTCDEENAQLKMLAANNRAFMLDDDTLISLVTFCAKIALIEKNSLLEQLGIERPKDKLLEIHDPYVITQGGVRAVTIYYLNTETMAQHWSVGRIEVKFNINGSASVRKDTDIGQASEKPR